MVFSAYLSACLGVRFCRLALSPPPLSLLHHRHQYTHSHRYLHTHTYTRTHQYPSTHTRTNKPQHQRHRQPQTLPETPLVDHLLQAHPFCYQETRTSSCSLLPLAVHLLQAQPFCYSDTTVDSFRRSYISMGKDSKRKHHKQRLEHCAATSYVAHWASCCKRSELPFSSMDSSTSLHDWIPSGISSSSNKPLVIDLHTHSTCSDGMFSPVQLVEKAAASGVQVLALTDHDTMAGVPAALETAQQLGIRLIPGVEISAKVTAKTKNSFEEPVHILGYYSCCGPARWQELETVLARIRDGRHHRAQSILSKLKLLKKPVTWESVVMMAGAGVAPGRLHIARALLEAGHVYSLREAFNKYLYDGGPAYASGCELAAEDAVRLICDTGGVAVLAHPWSLKDALPVVKRLKEVGLQGMEVYRGDGRANVLKYAMAYGWSVFVGFAILAETYELLKLGGSDFHGRGDPEETKLGRVVLPSLAIREFLQVAEPIWRSAVKELLLNFAEESFQISTEKVTGLKYFTGLESFKGDLVLEYSIEKELCKVSLRLSPWLTEEDRQAIQEAVTQLKLQVDIVAEEGRTQCIVSRQIS